MAKTLFKGIQQVTMDTFNAADEKKGYLWLVREPMADVEGSSENPLGNDRYHIYFGTRCYGSFWEGEHEALAASLEAVRVAIGLSKDFTFAWEETTTVVAAFNKVKEWYDALAKRVTDVENNKADKTALADYVADVEYAEGKISFKNAEGTQIAEVDASPFIKDGMLSDVDIYTATAEDIDLIEGEKYIKFVWNTDGGAKEDYILASEIGATYTAGEGIEISTENAISVKEVASAKVNVNEIPVGGTPLADILTAEGIKTINAGNLQQVLEALFSQNLWSEDMGKTPKRNVPRALDISMSAPSISYDKTGTLEVGTTVELSASAKTASASASITYSDFVYGYSEENDNTKDGETPTTVSITGTQVEGSDYALSFVTNSGFGGADVADVAGSSTSGNELVVAEGTNKVTVTATAPSFTATVPAQDAVYACSSLGKTDAEHVVAASEASTINSTSKTATNNASVTGAYKLFVGASATKIADSDGIKGLASNKWTNGTTAVSFAGGTFPAGQYATIAMPSAWSLKEVKNGMDLVITDNFATVDTVKYVLPDNSEVDYKVYSNLYGADVAYNSIKIGK